MSVAGYPSLRVYLTWAEAQGFAVDVKPIIREGRALQIVTISAPQGGVAVETAMELDDPLMSTTIARLDRRLRMKSHLFR